ncbi:hypothetical protein H7K24_19325 [Mycobacterium fragae]|uniref:Uncharacterized protein n=1 Tax=Mycobacterium fragae TaxID=1260918 RepID=A0A1X1US36_9MYCO|nr:hypothetical protein [Mycobacterium fragae]MCV7402292.1 hypothetical protein [Mycobacterium fragae]ORV59675.1 hypothetical protein AWC06_16265 [Mycobacterium fragae]
MGDFLTEILPGLAEAGCAVAAQPDQRRHPINLLYHGVVPAARVDDGPRQTVGPEGAFEDPDGFLTNAFVKPLRGVAAHRGDDRRRLGEYGRDLLAQRIDLSGEVVDDRANVIGDLFDLVFVLIGQKLPDLF